MAIAILTTERLFLPNGHTAKFSVTLVDLTVLRAPLLLESLLSHRIAPCRLGSI